MHQIFWLFYHCEIHHPCAHYPYATIVLFLTHWQLLGLSPSSLWAYPALAIMYNSFLIHVTSLSLRLSYFARTNIEWSTRQQHDTERAGQLDKEDPLSYNQWTRDEWRYTIRVFWNRDGVYTPILCSKARTVDATCTMHQHIPRGARIHSGTGWHMVPDTKPCGADVDASHHV